MGVAFWSQNGWPHGILSPSSLSFPEAVVHTQVPVLPVTCPPAPLSYALRAGALPFWALEAGPDRALCTLTLAGSGQLDICSGCV